MKWALLLLLLMLQRLTVHDEVTNGSIEQPQSKFAV